MKRATDNKKIAKFVKLSKICTIMTAIAGVVCFGVLLLTFLKEFSRLEEKAPFLYGKIFWGSLLAVFSALIVLTIVCYIKARKCQKSIAETKNEENDDETNDR